MSAKVSLEVKMEVKDRKIGFILPERLLVTWALLVKPTHVVYSDNHVGFNTFNIW